MSEIVTLQMLHYANRPLQLPTMALQQSPPFISVKSYKQDAKKSSLMNHGWFQNSSINGYQSYHWPYSHQPLPTKNRR